MKKPKRSDFLDLKDYKQALQVYELACLACEYGCSLQTVQDLLERFDGGFSSWGFLFK